MNNQREGEDFFYGVYRASNEGVLTKIRRETYGEDLGQFSWITADELRKFFRKLDLNADSHVLDVACGSGGPALFTAQTLGCHVTGLDISENGILAAREMAQVRGLQNQATFEHADANQPIPFPDASFDAVISIDAMNHLSRRAEVFAEWLRVLRPGGRFLFTDAVIVTGMLSRDEILARSRSMGHFLFTPGRSARTPDRSGRIRRTTGRRCNRHHRNGEQAVARRAREASERAVENRNAGRLRGPAKHARRRPYSGQRAPPFAVRLFRDKSRRDAGWSCTAGLKLVTR